jgi:hypothetical protein
VEKPGVADITFVGLNIVDFEKKLDDEKRELEVKCLTEADISCVILNIPEGSGGRQTQVNISGFDQGISGPPT